MRKARPLVSLARAVALFSALSLASATAHGQQDQARRDAEARFREGLARVQSNDFEGARLAFAQAFAVLKSADVLWNLALSEHKSNHPLEALAHFKEYVRDARTTEPERVKARKYIDELHARVGRVAVDAPVGAALMVDGRAHPQTAPLSEPIDVSPGEHFVEARLADRSRLLRVHAAAGSVVTLQFRADELVAGGSNGAASAPTTAGPNAGDPATGTPPAGDDPRDDKTRLIVSGAVVGAGVLAGIGAVAFAISSSSSASDADAIRSLSGAPKNACATPGNADCAKLNEARESEISKQNLAVGFGVAAGALIVGGVATYFLWPSTPKSPAARGPRIVPMVGPTNGAWLTTSF